MSKNLIVLTTLVVAFLHPSLALGAEASHQLIISSLSAGIENSRKLMVGLAVLTVFTICAALIYLILRIHRRDMAIMNTMFDRLDILEAIVSKGDRPSQADTIQTAPEPIEFRKPVSPTTEIASQPEPETSPKPATPDATQPADSNIIRNTEIRVMLKNLNKKHAHLEESVELHAMDGRQISEAEMGDDGFAQFPDPIQLNRDLVGLLTSMKKCIESVTPVLAGIESSETGKSPWRLPWPVSVLQRDDRSRAIRILRGVGEIQALLEKFFYFYQQKCQKFSALGNDKVRTQKMLLLNHELAVVLTQIIGPRLYSVSEAIARLKLRIPMIAAEKTIEQSVN